jgi:hypothetical protein
MVYRKWPRHRSQSRSAELRRPSKLDVYLVGDGSGLAGQDQTRLPILGFKNVARPHVDLAGNHGAHARTAPTFAARVRYIDARLEQHVDERGPSRPTDAVAVPVQFHISY